MTNLNDHYLKIYFNWINNRHNIWLNRFIYKLPREEWTDDEILKSYKFTNAYRELDAGTLYYTGVMVPKFKSKADCLINTIYYKIFNTIISQECTGLIDVEKSNWDEIIDKLNNSKDSVFTTAHMVNSFVKFANYGNLKERIIRAIQHQVGDNIDSILDKFNNAESFEECFKLCHLFPGVGPFVAYEILVHLHMAGFFGNRFSLDDFSNPGPGASAFIEYLVGHYITEGSQEAQDILFYLLENQDKYFDEFNIDFKGPRLSLLNIENACCESSKYVKALEDTGRPRNFFNTNKNLNDQYYNLMSKNKLIISKFVDLSNFEF